MRNEIYKQTVESVRESMNNHKTLFPGADKYTGSQYSRFNDVRNCSTQSVDLGIKPPWIYEIAEKH